MSLDPSCHQTLVNKLNLYIYLLILVYNTTGFNIACARAVGPVPAIACWIYFAQVRGHTS